MPANRQNRPRWKNNILHSAIAAVCANGLFVPQAQATCGPTVSVSQGQCIFTGSDSENIINEGVTISTTDQGPSVSVLYQGYEGANLTNNGRIEASESADSSQAYGVHYNTSFNNGGIFNNRGQINATVSGNSGTASGVTINSFDDGVVNNYGSISAQANGSTAYAKGFHATTANNAELNNFGTIEGSAENNYRGFSLDIDGGEDSIFNNQESGVLRGQIDINGTNQTLNNDGLIDLDTIDTTGWVSGNFNQSSSGTLRITATGAGEDDHSWIQVTGTANITGKAFVDVEEVNTLAVGQTMENVLLANQLNGNFSEVNDNSTLFNFVSIATEGSNGRIDFEITKGMTALESVITSGNPTGEGGAEVLDEIIEEGTTDPDMQKVIDALGRLSSEQQVSDAVSQTLPLITGNSAIASTSTLSGIRRVVQARIEAHRGVSYGDSYVAADNELWIKPFGSRVDQDDRDGVSGFEGRTTGLVFGVDGMRSEKTRLGISFAYAKANIDSNSTAAPNSAEVDVYQLLGYGTHDLGEGRELHFQAGFGQNKTKGERDILFLNETAKSNYSSLSATAGIGLADTYQLNEVTKFVPSARADYTWIRDESYTETGSSANLQVDSHSTDELILAVDAKVSYELSPSTDVTANLTIGFDALDAPSSITASFAGAPGSSFVTEGLDSSPWLQRAGFGVIKTTEHEMEISLRYDAEHRESFLNQTVSVKLRWDF